MGPGWQTCSHCLGTRAGVVCAAANAHRVWIVLDLLHSATYYEDMQQPATLKTAEAEAVCVAAVRARCKSPIPGALPCQRTEWSSCQWNSIDGYFCRLYVTRQQRNIGFLEATAVGHERLGRSLWKGLPELEPRRNHQRTHRRYATNCPTSFKEGSPLKNVNNTMVKHCNRCVLANELQVPPVGRVQHCMRSAGSYASARAAGGSAICIYSMWSTCDTCNKASNSGQKGHLLTDNHIVAKLKRTHFSAGSHRAKMGSFTSDQHPSLHAH